MKCPRTSIPFAKRCLLRLRRAPASLPKSTAPRCRWMLAQRLRGLSAMAPRAVEDQEYVVAVVVELRALTKVLGVFERERMKPEQFAQLREILMTRGREVQPEEVITLKVVADPRLVDACATRHHELELLAGGVYRCCLRLAYGHGSSPWSLRARHSPPGRACSK